MPTQESLGPGLPVRPELVRALVYDAVITTGQIPSVAALARAAGASVEATGAVLRHLADNHVLVLQSGSDEILMAMPFSAVPTAFLVEAGRYHAFANCIWDAFGVASILRRSMTIRTSCPCCGTSIAVDTQHLPDDGSISHFVVPASRWWANVTYT